MPAGSSRGREATRKRRRRSAVNSLAAIVEIYETRQMLSGMPLGFDTYASQTDQAATNYVAPIQAKTVMPTQSALELAVSAITANAAELTSQANQTTLDLPAGLDTLVAQVDVSSTTNSTQSGSADPTADGNVSADSATATGGTASQPALFEYGSNLSQYSTSTTQSALGVFSQPPSLSASTDSPSPSTDSLSAESDGDDSSPAPADEPDQSSFPAWVPFEFPETSDLEALQLPSVALFADPLSIRPTRWESFSTTTELRPTYDRTPQFIDLSQSPSEVTAPAAMQEHTTSDTTSDATVLESSERSDETGTRDPLHPIATSEFRTTLMVTQDYVDADHWTITETLTRTYDTQESSGGAKTQAGGRSLSSTLTLTVVNGDSMTFSYSAKDSFSDSTSESTDATKPATATVSTSIDTSSFSASLQVQASISLSYSDTKALMPDGSPGRTRSLDFSTSRSGSFSIRGSYEISESSGTVINLPTSLPSSKDSFPTLTVAKGNNPPPVLKKDDEKRDWWSKPKPQPTVGPNGEIIPPVVDPLNPNLDGDNNPVLEGDGPDSIQVGGNGYAFNAMGQFSMGGAASSSSYLNASATSPEGAEMADSEITGKAGFSLSSGGSTSLADSLSFDSQFSSGDGSIDTDEYDYLSLGYSNNSAGGSSISTSLDVDLSAADEDTDAATDATDDALAMIPYGAAGQFPSGTATESSVTSTGSGTQLLSAAIQLNEDGTYQLPNEEEAADDGENDEGTDPDKLPEGFHLNAATSNANGGGISYTYTTKTRTSDFLGGIQTVISATTVSSIGQGTFDSGLFDQDGSFNASLSANFSSSQTTATIDIKRDYLATQTVTGGTYFGPASTITIDTLSDRREEGRSTNSSSTAFSISIDLAEKGPAVTMTSSNVSVEYTLSSAREAKIIHDSLGVKIYEMKLVCRSGYEKTQTMTVTFDSVEGGKVDGESKYRPIQYQFFVETGINPLDPPPPSPEEVAAWNNLLDKVQTALDVVGLVPGLGEIADLANVAIHLARGNNGEALLSLAAMIPFAGAAVTLGKFAQKGGKALAKHADTAADVVAQSCKKGNCFVAGTQVVVRAEGLMLAEETTILDQPLETLVVELPEESRLSVALIGMGLAVGLLREVTRRDAPKPPRRKRSVRHIKPV